MLTARNFVALTLVIAVVSLAWACRELARPPDSGGLAGTRTEHEYGASGACSRSSPIWAFRWSGCSRRPRPWPAAMSRWCCGNHNPTSCGSSPPI